MINLICKMKRIWLVASNHVSRFRASYHYSIHLAYPFVIGYVLIEIRKLLQFPTPGKFSVFVSVLHDLVATRIFESQAFVDAFFLCRKYPYSCHDTFPPFFSIKRKGRGQAYAWTSTTSSTFGFFFSKIFLTSSTVLSICFST